MIPGAGDLMLFGGGAAAGDPYFANVSLLMHMDGANDGTVFTDVTGKAITRLGNTATKTAAKQFGTASSYFDGTNDYLQLASSDAFHFGSGDVTIEGWIYEIAPGATRQIIGKHSTGTELSTFLIGSDQGKLFFSLYKNQVANYAMETTAHSLNTWHHFAGVRYGSTITIYLNGVAKGTATTAFTVDTNALNVTIGHLMNGSIPLAATGFEGYIDELRVTKGVARYTANFTPPSSAFLDF